jgi:pimeloyl-ACP methyl ester carboxylesterase
MFTKKPVPIAETINNYSKKMKTKLIEFQNAKNKTLRGILTLPNKKTSRSAICLHGFERCSTTEKKFKIISDSLVKDMIAVFRFDFSGCGLSDGNFKFTTLKRQTEDFVIALKRLKTETKYNKINVITHSFGACVLAAAIDKIEAEVDKIILIAPALNLKDLLRYWFVVSEMKKNNPKIKIDWHNYTKYLDESAFQKDCEKSDKMTKANYINPNYFLEIKELDLSKKFDEMSTKVLHIHGLEDTIVPIESLNTKFENNVIIKAADHDLERPNQLSQWKNKVVDFLVK